MPSQRRTFILFLSIILPILITFLWQTATQATPHPQPNSVEEAAQAVVRISK